jgi:hypothetical protein
MVNIIMEILSRIPQKTLGNIGRAIVIAVLAILLVILVPKYTGVSKYFFSDQVSCENKKEVLFPTENDCK